MYNWFGIMGTSESLFSAKALLLGREMFSFFCKEECNRIPFWLKSCSEWEFQRDRKSNISYLGVFKPNADDRYYFPLDSPICSFPISQLQEMSHDQSKSGMETPLPSARTRIPATLWLGRVITNPGQKDEMYMCWRGSPLLFIFWGVIIWEMMSGAAEVILWSWIKGDHHRKPIYLRRWISVRQEESGSWR